MVIQYNGEEVMNVNVCGVCGHIEFGEVKSHCPVCFAPKEKFTQNNAVFTEAEEKSKEAAVKHIPSIKVNKQCELIPEDDCLDITVRIGATLHPMEEKHHIQWIDCYVDEVYVSRIQLTPGVFAAGCFHLKVSGKSVHVVEFCNLHGHWQSKTMI